MMEASLTTLLLTTAEITNLVGNRIAWVRQPGGVDRYPYVNLQVVSEPHVYHLGGRTGPTETRVQIDVWAETIDDAKAVGIAILDRLSGFAGAVDDTAFQGVFCDAVRDSEDRSTGGEARLYRQMIDIRVLWSDMS